MVSLSALHEERGRRKATESEKRALENQLAELRGKFSIIERLQPPAAEAPAPTIENDIFGVVRNTTESVAEIQRRLRAEDEQKRADGERSHLMTRLPDRRRAVRGQDAGFQGGLQPSAQQPRLRADGDRL